MLQIQEKLINILRVSFKTNLKVYPLDLEGARESAKPEGHGANTENKLLRFLLNIFGVWMFQHRENQVAHKPQICHPEIGVQVH